MKLKLEISPDLAALLQAKRLSPLPCVRRALA